MMYVIIEQNDSFGASVRGILSWKFIWKIMK